MTEKRDTKLLAQVLPNVASQMRLSMGNLHTALRRTTPADSRDSQEVAIIQQSYYRMLRLATNLSAAPMLLETDLFPTENVDLPVWLGGLFRQAQPLAEEIGLTVQFTTPLTSHITAIHQVHMERLVWNLLSNAFKFTPAGGKVTISLRCSGGQVILRVQDTGCGIREDLLDTVFDRCLHPQQIDPPPFGLGLGLPLCRRIAEGHGGRLLLTSQEGKGTTVTVSLPDRQCDTSLLHEHLFHYAGGFQPVMMELADALPFRVFSPRNLD